MKETTLKVSIVQPGTVLRKAVLGLDLGEAHAVKISTGKSLVHDGVLYITEEDYLNEIAPGEALATGLSVSETVKDRKVRRDDRS